MKRWYLFLGSLLALLGLMIIIFPAFWIKVVVILLGLGMIAYGIYSLKVTKTLFDDSTFTTTILVKSIGSIIIGVLSVFFPLAFSGTVWTVMIWVLIISLILSAILGFYTASLLKDTGIDRKNYFLENLFLLIAALVLILISPKQLGIAIVRIIGIAVMVIGGALIIVDLTSKKQETELSVEVKDDSDPSDSDATASGTEPASDSE
ncbi:MAG: DUF308 domain-containing protein [Treponema sp.]|nr:DUF308 domain-containing protein [Treponema sp.]